MHIPENYLSPVTCAAAFAVMIPTWQIALKKVKTQIKKKPDMVPMIGIGAALSFLVMMFNFPIPGGTTAHAVGGTLLAILIGPYAACIAISITLLVQAVMFGDGGLLAFGINTFNMSFLMPFVGYGVYTLFAKNRYDKIGAAAGSYFGMVTASLAVGIELGIQPLLFHTTKMVPKYFPYGLKVTIPAMVGSHILLIGFVEAAFTIAIYSFVKRTAKHTLYFYNDSLKSIDTNNYHFWFSLLGVLAILTPLGLLAGGSAWGEWGNSELLVMLKNQGISQQLPKGILSGINYQALFGDYQIKSVSSTMGYLMIALTVFAISLIVVKVWHYGER